MPAFRCPVRVVRAMGRVTALVGVPLSAMVLAAQQPQTKPQQPVQQPVQQPPPPAAGGQGSASAASVPAAPGGVAPAAAASVPGALAASAPANNSAPGTVA